MEFSWRVRVQSRRLSWRPERRQKSTDSGSRGVYRFAMYDQEYHRSIDESFAIVSIFEWREKVSRNPARNFIVVPRDTSGRWTWVSHRNRWIIYSFLFAPKTANVRKKNRRSFLRRWTKFRNFFRRRIDRFSTSVESIRFLITGKHFNSPFPELFVERGRSVITRLTIVSGKKNRESREKGNLWTKEGHRKKGHARLHGTIRKRANLGLVLIANMTVLNFPLGRCTRN